VLDDGRTVLRRLSRGELTNTLRDLLGTSLALRDVLPADDIFNGFDRVGEALVVSPLWFEILEQAVSTAVDELVSRPAGDPVRARILTCEPTAATLSSCATAILTPFMKRAYRRPVTADEVLDRVTLASDVAASSGDAMSGLEAALTSVLLSPHLVFLMPGESADPASPGAQPLEDHALASRLSYFLWSTMPDDALTADADQAALTAPGGGGLEAQVARMLGAPRAQGFVDDFAGQWLYAQYVGSVVADPPQFGAAVDATLLDAMGRETRLFFGSLLTEDQPLGQLLTADYTFVNDRLASHYGLPTLPSPLPSLPASASSAGFARVSLAGTPRLGFLTEGTFLAVTSFPTRTSPSRRASFVLDNILCQPPPPPPPSVPALPSPQPPLDATYRQILEAATSPPDCAICHVSLNPLGFAFGAFDAIGAYQPIERGTPVDLSVKLPDGTQVNGAAELARHLAADPAFTHCAAQLLLTYAVGRGFDSPEAKAYAGALSDPLYRTGTWPQLLRTVVKSEAFRTNRGELP
jgi:hypothetical protein